MQEISITAGLSFYKPSIMAAPIGAAQTDAKFSVSGQFFTRNTISINTSATPIELANVSSPHWAYFLNKDAVNTIYLFNGVAGAYFAELRAGEFCIVPLYSLSTPYAVADTLPSLLEYLVISL